MKFDDIKLNQNYPLQLQFAGADGQERRFPCRLLGTVPGKHVMVSLPRSRKGAVRLRSGQQLLVRMMVETGIVTFRARVEGQSASPYPLLFLDYPEQLSFTEIRAATRIDVAQPLVVRNRDALEGAESAGQFVDISTKGARLALEQPIGSVGDRLDITSQVAIGSLTCELRVTGVIRARIERSTREQDVGQPAVYGIEFTENDEDKLLVLYGYVYSEMASGAKVSAER